MPTSPASLHNDLFQKIRSIQPFSTESERKLLDRLGVLHVEKKGKLLSVGQVCKGIWFIEQGFARSVCFNDTNDVSLGFYGKGDFVTNLSSLRNGALSKYEIQVTEPSIVLSFEKQTLMELYEVSHEIARFGRGLLEQLLTEQEEHANLFKLKTPAERYAFLLKSRPSLFQKATLTQIASYIGVSRESLSRIRGHK